MPAWIAGIQICKDASGNIHVNLDSSTPCWNDAIEAFYLKLTEAPPPRIFKGHEEHEGRENHSGSKALQVVYQPTAVDKMLRVGYSSD